MATIAIANQKGGVGKTASTYHLAHAAAESGFDVLVVDADQQGNATRALGPDDLTPRTASLADALAPHTPTTLAQVIVNTDWDRIDLVPAGGDNLAAIESVLAAGMVGRESHLRDALAPVADDYGLILIDCSPSIGLLTVNALTAADGVLVVARPDLWSLDGLGRLFHTVGQVQDRYHPDLITAGVLVNGYDRRTRQGAHWTRTLRDECERAGIDVLGPYIPQRQVIADAQEMGMTLRESRDPGAELADLYAGHLSTIVAAVHP